MTFFCHSCSPGYDGPWPFAGHVACIPALSTTEKHSPEVQPHRAIATSPMFPVGAPQDPTSPSALPCGEPRPKWLAAHLLRVLHEEIEEEVEEHIALASVQSKVLADL